jgi:GNAT superfamily N-acetyltransferase
MSDLLKLRRISAPALDRTTPYNANLNPVRLWSGHFALNLRDRGAVGEARLIRNSRASPYLSQTQPAMRRSRVRRAAFGASLLPMSQLHHDSGAIANSLGVPGSAAAQGLENSWQRGDCRRDRTQDRIMVLSGPLRPAEWHMIQAFIRKTDREDLRLRFGQWLDFENGPILRQFFDIGGKSGELVCALDENGDISGILHRVLTSPCEAEIGLIVRSDLKRMGIGQKLVRVALARATQQNLKTLRALVLGENHAMLRLARKLGMVRRKSAGFSVELEFDLRQIKAGTPTPLPAVAVATKSPASALC